RKTRRDRAGVVLPLRTGVKPVRVFGEASGGVLLRIDRDRHQVHLGRLGPELALELLQRAAGERADRRAGGENEVEEHRPSVIELTWQRHAPAVLAQQADVRSL